MASDFAIVDDYADNAQRGLNESLRAEDNHHKREFKDDRDLGEGDEPEVHTDKWGSYVILKSEILSGEGLDSETRSLLADSLEGLDGVQIGAQGPYEKAYSEAIVQLGTRLGRFARRGKQRIEKTWQKRRSAARDNFTADVKGANTEYKNRVKAARKEFSDSRKLYASERDTRRRAAKKTFEGAWNKLKEDKYEKLAGELKTNLLAKIEKIDKALGRTEENGDPTITGGKRQELESKKKKYQRVVARLDKGTVDALPGEGELPARTTAAVPGRMVTVHAGTMYGPLANPQLGKKYAKRVFKWTDTDIANERKDAIEYFKERTGIDFAKAKEDEATGALIYSIKDKEGNTHQAARLEPYALNTPNFTESNAVEEISGFGNDADTGATMHEVGFKLKFLRKVRTRGEMDREVPADATMYYGKWIVANEMENPDIDPRAVLIHFETPEPAGLTAGPGENEERLHVKYNILYQDLQTPFAQEYIGEAQRKVSYHPVCDHAGNPTACKTKCITKIKFD